MMYVMNIGVALMIVLMNKCNTRCMNGEVYCSLFNLKDKYATIKNLVPLVIMHIIIKDIMSK